VAESTSVSADELAALEFFMGCPVESLEPLAARLRPLVAAPGQVLLRQGEQAVSFFLIGCGHAEVVHDGPDGDIPVTGCDSVGSGFPCRSGHSDRQFRHPAQLSAELGRSDRRCLVRHRNRDCHLPSRAASRKSASASAVHRRNRADLTWGSGNREDPAQRQRCRRARRCGRDLKVHSCRPQAGGRTSGC
jgi:CRP-like cAMP-binding protein